MHEKKTALLSANMAVGKKCSTFCIAQVRTVCATTDGNTDPAFYIELDKCKFDQYNCEREERKYT